MYSATAAVVVQSRLHEPWSVYHFASFWVRQKSITQFCERLALDPGVATARASDSGLCLRLFWRVINVHVCMYVS